MKKSLAFICIFLCIFTEFTFISEVVAVNPSEEGSFSLQYPEGEDFGRLKAIIDSTFTKQEKKSYQVCLAWGWLCPNYKYTSLSEKAIKYITLKTYKWNEKFYRELFSSYSTSSFGTSSFSQGNNFIIGGESFSLPKGISVTNPFGSFFGQSSYSSNVADDLLMASFWINFSDNPNGNGMIGAIDQKIRELKTRNCQKLNTGSDSYKKCPWGGKVSNRYLPTMEELLKENIYLNGLSVKIDSLKDEFDYILSWSTQINIAPLPSSRKNAIDSLDDAIRADFQSAEWDNPTSASPQRPFSYKEFDFYFISKIEGIRKKPSYDTIDELRQIITDFTRNGSSYSFTQNQKLYTQELLKEIDFYEEQLSASDENLSYILRYKKETFTLEEANNELNKKVSVGQLRSVADCSKTNAFPTLTECQDAMKARQSVWTALWAYFSDRERYPDSIDALNTNYIPNQKILETFNKYFLYKFVPNTYSDSDLISLKEDIWIRQSSEEEKKDYIALLQGSTVPEIPAIFSHVPKDSMVLYVKNPQDLLSLLNTQSNTTSRLSGIDVSDSIKKVIQTFFELEDMSQIEQNLKSDLIFIVDNLDITAPDVTMILSESDKAALSPTAQARVVGSKDGFIFVASSKARVNSLIELPVDISMAKASDFQYVWTKKSTQIQDAFLYVGDEFFEKMITLESYIKHFRKYRDVDRLSSLQELSWAYEEAFGEKSKDIPSLLAKIGNSDTIKNQVSSYSIEDGIITNDHIGSLKNLKTLEENNYDLSIISRAEIESYKANILRYKEIWRASLDPMGIVLNRHGDGIEFDFFMTPIPTFPDSGMNEVRQVFEWVTKKSLNFITNKNIRIGLLSFVVWFDPKKFEEKLTSNKSLQQNFSDFNREVLGGKNLFEYLGWEFAFSLGNFPEDIFEGWNVEKIDAYLSLQVVNEEKWKELIEILRKKITDEFGWEKSSWASQIQAFLAKPLIEDYGSGKIYYVDAIPFPFVGKVWFAYTFVDDFFFLAPNRPTIRRIIDTGKSGDMRKNDIIGADSSVFDNSFFATLFDGESTSKDIRWLYEKNKKVLPRYMSSLKSELGSSSFIPLISRYYASSLKDTKLWKKTQSFSYTFGWFSIDGDNGDIRVHLDEEKYTHLTGSTLDVWIGLTAKEGYPKEILSKEGISIDTFLDNVLQNDILTVVFMAHIDDVFSGTESLLRNMTFAFNMWDNEIGFNTKIFRKSNTISQKKDEKVSYSDEKVSSWWQNYGLLLWAILLGLSFLGGWVFYALKRKKQWQNIVQPPTHTVLPVLNPSWIIDESGSIIIAPAPVQTETLITPSVPSGSVSWVTVSEVSQQTVSAPPQTPSIAQNPQNSPTNP